MEKKGNLKNKKKFKTIILMIMIIFFFLIGINYNTYKTINLEKIFNIMLLDNNNYSDNIIDKNTIEENEKIEVGEENSIGISTNKYSLELDEDYDYISTISIKADDNLEENNFLLTLYSGDVSFSYSIDDFITNNNDETIFVINESNIDKISINSVTEEFDNEAKEGKTISIEQIEINDIKDIQEAKKTILIKSIFLIIIIILLFILYFILKKLKKYDKVPNDRLPTIFFVTSMIVGTIFSILFPLYQIPDEMTHINMMYSEMNMEVDFYNETDCFGDTLRIMHNYDEKVNVDKYFSFGQKLLVNDDYGMPKISLLRHFPQAIGMIIGEIFNLPIIISITLAELLAVLFYSFVCSKALKIIPIKKELMMAIMLLPICIQQMGSFSYDAVLLPICFYFISYVFYLKFSKKKIILKDIIILILLLVGMALIKIPYILLGALIFLLPIDKLDFNFHCFRIDYNFIKKNTKKIIYISLPIIIVIAFLTIKVLSKISYGRMLIAAILEAPYSLKMILTSINLYKFGYIRELTGEFGWFDTPTSDIYTIFIVLCILIICFINFKKNKNNNQIVEKNPFKKKEIVFMYVLGLAMIFLIVLSMFSWTAYVTGYTNFDTLSISEIRDLFKTLTFIGGVQGRYFLPIIPILLIPIYNKRITKFISKFNISLFLILYYLIAFVYMAIVVLLRYWI